MPQYIWKFQYCKKNELTTMNGNTLFIIYPGNYNVNQGQDFTEAKVKINNTLWAGNVELHLKSSHWNLHKHFAGKNYNNIILHIVWNHDAVIKDSNKKQSNGLKKFAPKKMRLQKVLKN